MILAAVALTLDAAVVLCVAAAVVAVGTAGLDLTLLGGQVSVHSPHNPVIAAVLLMGVRYYLQQPLPFLGVPGWDLHREDSQWQALFSATRRRLASLTVSRARLIVIAAAGGALALKMWNAATHDGFFSGDDVEVHEMTLGALWDRDWPVSALRSAFFPSLFIYPGQALAASLGVTDTATLVVIGRWTVAVLSSITVPFVWAVARRQYGVPVALLGAIALAGSHLQISFGGTELPRPVATLFVLAAFGALQRESLRSSAAAGVLLAIGAAMRFSEVVFLAPAALQLLIERRFKTALVCGVTCGMTLAVIQVASDAWYWNEPLHSAKAIVQFTLVERGSTRGYEPAWRYLETINTWTDPLLFGLAVWATRRRQWREAIWMWLPILLLSCLPHKESRYLIPITPYLSLLAATGAWQLIGIAADANRQSLGMRFLRIGFAMSVVGAVLINVSGYRVTRTDAEVELGRDLGRTDAGVGLAAEQIWRLGGRLYLGERPVVDLESLRDPFPAIENERIGLLVLPEDRCGAWSCDQLVQAGWKERVSEASREAGYRVFRRAR